MALERRRSTSASSRERLPAGTPAPAVRRAGRRLPAVARSATATCRASRPRCSRAPPLDGGAAPAGRLAAGAAARALRARCARAAPAPWLTPAERPRAARRVPRAGARSGWPSAPRELLMPLRHGAHRPRARPRAALRAGRARRDPGAPAAATGVAAAGDQPAPRRPRPAARATAHADDRRRPTVIRLFNSLTQRKEELRAARPRQGRHLLPAVPRSTTSCTSATPGPTSSSPCCAPGCTSRGLRRHAGREHHRRGRQDHQQGRTPRAARPSRWPPSTPQAYVDDTDRLGVPRPDIEPLATRDHPRDHRPRLPAHRRGPRLRGPGQRLLSRAQLRRVRQALQAAHRRARGGRPRRGRARQGGPARLRRLEGRQARRAAPGTAPGARAGPAGTSSARPWACAIWAPASTSTAAAATSSSRTTRTRSPRAEAAGMPFARVWMHNGMIRSRRREDGQVASATSSCCARCSTATRAPVVLTYFLTTHYRSPLEFCAEKLDEAKAAYGRLLEARARRRLPRRQRRARRRRTIPPELRGRARAGPRRPSPSTWTTT